MGKNLNISGDELNVFKIIENKDEVLPTIQFFDKKLRAHDHSKCKICKGKECAFIT